MAPMYLGVRREDLLEFKDYGGKAPNILIPTVKCLAALAYPDRSPDRRITPALDDACPDQAQAGELRDGPAGMDEPPGTRADTELGPGRREEISRHRPASSR